MTKHAYSSDHGERTRILFKIGALSVGAAWLLHLVLGYLPVAVPWLIDTPSVLGFFALFRTTFDKYLWRKILIRKVIGITTPDLNGTWNGQLLSSHSDHSLPVDATLTIIQTWTSIQISLETSTSLSQSQVASFETDRNIERTLTYQYLSEPKPGAIETMQTHRGTAELRIKNNGALLEGDYYTGRGRLTFGTLNFKRVP